MMKILLMMIFLFFMFNMNKKYLQLIYQFFLMLMFINLLMLMINNSFYMNLYYYMGMDVYSWSLSLLSLWILNLMMMSSNKIINLYYYMNYMIIFNFIMIFIIMCFFSINFMMFYIYFESSLIMILFLVMGWGVQVERIYAGYYMMLYTLFGSLPLLMILIYLYLIEYTLEMKLVFLEMENYYIYLSLILAFLIKLPMYFFHMWLPKAHVEAPVMGSMILAGLMLKLGSYGLMRVMFLMMNMNMKFNKFLMILSLMGGIYSSMICLNQYDMKMLVAYSSIVHMSILLSGMMTLFNWGIMGSILMMISHGLCSSGMFYMVNLNYERLMSRSLYFNKGMMNYLPMLSLLWFLLCSSNLSFPPSLNLFSEIYLFNSLISWNKFFMFMIMVLLLFSASYSLYLFMYIQHGKFIKSNFLFYNNNVIEFMIVMLHWIPLNLLFIYMNLFF